MKKISYVNRWLLVGVIVSVYILTTRIFPWLQIPFSVFDEEGTLLFNNVMEKIAISYLVSVLIYYITMIIRNKNNRKRRRWELHDILKDYHTLEDITSERWNLFDEDRYKELTPEQVFKLKQEYEHILKELHKYDNVLTEEELDCLQDISRNLDFEVCTSEMQPIEIEKNVGQIREINKNIVKLQCGFSELIKH